MKNKLLRAVIAFIVLTILNLIILFFANFVLENDSDAYAEKIELSNIIIGLSENTGLDDYEIKNWADNDDPGIPAKDLPKAVLNHEFKKCTKVETMLVFMVQNRFNSKIEIVPIDPAINTTNPTLSVDYIRVFGTDYILSTYENESLRDKNLGVVCVAYRTSDDISGLLEEFETEKGYYLEVFPMGLTCLFFSGTAELYAIIFIIFEMMLALIFIFKQRKTQLKSNKKKNSIKKYR